MEIGLTQYLTVAAILFTIGVLGIFLNRKNIIIILMSVELILNSVNINFVAFSTYQEPFAVEGQVFALFVIVLAAAEATFGGQQKAGTWLRRPTSALRGERPLHLLDTDEGTREVENLLGRIGHGIAA